ncbi:hypothetical protein BGX20_008799 [Mortierella sp. AD010]|nr:hypothetical protein BGX20_008799 [Mortierella sp. AD010]
MSMPTISSISVFDIPLIITETWNILTNAHRIRKLEIDLADAKYLINSNCTQLTDLSCVDFEYTTWRSFSTEAEENNIGDTTVTTFNNNDATTIATTTTTAIAATATTIDEYWNESYDHFWQNVDPSVNALSLISRNPNLRTLTVKHLRSRIYLQPFTKEVVATLSVHPFLTRISINIRLEVATLISILTNCPPKLKELEIWLNIFEDIEKEETDSQMKLPRSTALRRLILHDSLCSYEKAVLVPLLKQCPVLEEVKLPQLDQAIYQEVLATMIESCPILHSFENTNRPGFDIGRGMQLIQGFSGLRQVIMNCTGILGGEPITPGATIKALLASSAGTLEVLKMYNRFSRWNPDAANNWIMGVVAVLEQCPNLKELEIPHGCVSLDDLIPKKDWSRPSWVDISTTKKEKMVLPWVCKKLENLSLNIDNPSTKSFDPTLDPSLLSSQTNETFEELSYTTVMQLGLLCQTLRSLKSLRDLDLAWDPFVLGAIGSMPFDRASFYYESHEGLQGITQQDIRWLGIEWCTIAERAQHEQFDRICRVARKRYSHSCTVLEDNDTIETQECEEDEADEDEEDVDLDPDVEWIWYPNQKKVSKSRHTYARRSLRNGINWFGKGAIDASRH